MLPEGKAPTIVKPVPEIVACEMFAAAVPLFVRVRFCEAVVAIGTLPNATVLDPALSTADLEPA